MNSDQIEKNVHELIQNFAKEEFIFDLLLAYGKPQATITLLKKGRHNLSKRLGEIILKKNLFFQEVQNQDLHSTIDDLQKDESTMRHSPRFIIVTDYKTLLAIDTKNNEHLDIQIKELPKHFTFFLPWAGIEKYQYKNENPADRKAAEKMAKLYDEILEENNISDEETTHGLNIFLSRLLFCFFAEDTNIFEGQLFTNSVASHTSPDGSDLHLYFEKLFDVLNTKDTSHLSAHFQKFPYVNGGLFSKKHWTPKFSKHSRKILIECGELNWAEINPDIFGSMIQAVVHPGQRASLGMHYTSVPNIMKVIEPLFLNELKEEFQDCKVNKKKLDDLRIRMSKIKFFDPACGSGNFLIITYKELRRLEMKIIEEMGVFSYSDISLSQFYGIELDDFAHEIAKLSLYLAEHQMNVEFKDKFGDVKPTLPLRESGNIVCGNATRIEWKSVCTKEDNDEIYIMGNPPYLGAKNQNIEQKEDMKVVFKKDFKNIDYISAWFYLAAKYIEGINAKLAFVSTNSVCQGEQVALIWRRVLSGNLEIFFAHQSFKWTNNAKRNAGVTVVVIGIQNKSNSLKKIFKNGQYSMNKNINYYLTAARDIVVERRSKPLSHLPSMPKGNMPYDKGNLILNEREKLELINDYPQSEKILKKLMGSSEFIKGDSRWCLWISNEDLKEAMSIPEVNKRIEEVRKIRLSSTDSGAHKLAERPHQFRETHGSKTHSIIVPSVSSERREYIPVGLLDADTIITNLAFAIYDAEPWIFGVISSRMHMTWVRAVAGRLKTDYRYSSALCYNTFPIPPLSEKQKNELTWYVQNILEEREKHSEKTMAQLYDPDKMPTGLKEAHHSLDLAVEKIYRSRPFESDEERLEFLFQLYEKMIEEEKNNHLKK